MVPLLERTPQHKVRVVGKEHRQPRLVASFQTTTNQRGTKRKTTQEEEEGSRAKRRRLQQREVSTAPSKKQRRGGAKGHPAAATKEGYTYSGATLTNESLPEVLEPVLEATRALLVKLGFPETPITSCLANYYRPFAQSAKAANETADGGGSTIDYISSHQDSELDPDSFVVSWSFYGVSEPKQEDLRMLRIHAKCIYDGKVGMRKVEDLPMEQGSVIVMFPGMHDKYPTTRENHVAFFHGVPKKETEVGRLNLTFRGPQILRGPQIRS